MFRLDHEVLSERRVGWIERVTFHTEESGFCVLRVKVKGQRDLATVLGSAASVTAGEFIECLGQWVNDCEPPMKFFCAACGYPLLAR